MKTCSRLLAIVLIAQLAMGSDYYVAKTGSDSNDGSSAHPWATISHAVSASSIGSASNCTTADGWFTESGVGACIHVLPGAYGTIGTTTHSGSSTTQKLIAVSETKWAAKITNPQWSQQGSNAGIVGFEMTAPTQTFVVDLRSGSGMEVQYNYIHDVNLSDCTPNGVIHNTTLPNLNPIINGNIIVHFGGCAANSHQTFHGIYSDGSGARLTNNFIAGGTGGWGIQKQYLPGEDCSPGVISGNTLINNQGGIVINENSSGCTFENWVFTDNIIAGNGIPGTGGGGGSSFGVDYYHMTGTHNLVSNNLIENNSPANYAIHGSACTGGTPGCPSSNAKSDSSLSATFVNYQPFLNFSPLATFNIDNYQIRTTSQAFGGGTYQCLAGSGGVCPGAPSLDLKRAAQPTPPHIGALAGAGVPTFTAPTGLTAIVQ